MSSVQNIIIGVIAVIVGVVLIGPVATQVTNLIGSTGALSSGGSFEAARSLAILIPLVFVAAIVVLPIYLVWSKVRGG